MEKFPLKGRSLVINTKGSHNGTGGTSYQAVTKKVCVLQFPKTASHQKKKQLYVDIKRARERERGREIIIIYLLIVGFLRDTF